MLNFTKKKKKTTVTLIAVFLYWHHFLKQFFLNYNNVVIEFVMCLDCIFHFIFIFCNNLNIVINKNWCLYLIHVPRVIHVYTTPINIINLCQPIEIRGTVVEFSTKKWLKCLGTPVLIYVSCLYDRGCWRTHIVHILNTCSGLYIISIIYHIM